MPKGQTSRPYNRKEKKAAKTRNSILSGALGKSPANQRTILMGPRLREATRTVTTARTKSATRKAGAAQERKTGKSIKNAIDSRTSKPVKRK